MTQPGEMLQEQADIFTYRFQRESFTSVETGTLEKDAILRSLNDERVSQETTAIMLGVTLKVLKDAIKFYGIKRVCRYE